MFVISTILLVIILIILIVDDLRNREAVHTKDYQIEMIAKGLGARKAYINSMKQQK